MIEDLGKFRLERISQSSKLELEEETGEIMFRLERISQSSKLHFIEETCTP